MIAETKYGHRDSRGNYLPNKKIVYGPLFSWPIKPFKIAKWLFFLPGYLLPWNTLYFVVAAISWFWLTPDTQTMTNFSPGWIAVILMRNLVIVAGFYGLFHYLFYVRKVQDSRFKFNGRWPGASSRFTLGTQTKDNVIWVLASGVPLVTAWEVVGHWLFATGRVGWLDWARNPVWFLFLMLAIPIIREVHFYWVHRLLHTKLLYKRFHALHHRNTNPGPWSGIAMHPVEHLIYFSSMAVHWVILSHPLHMVFNHFHLLLSPIPPHSGFERYEVADDASIETSGYAHYLHHKYFEVNYADGIVPLDKWFGTFHDGSPNAVANLRSKKSAALVAEND